MSDRREDDAAADTSAELEGVGVSLRELTAAIEGHYDRFLTSVEGLESPQAQTVIFSIVGKRLAAEGMPLGGMLKMVARSFGVELDGLEIIDIEGKTLVKHDKQVIARGSGRTDH